MRIIWEKTRERGRENTLRSLTCTQSHIIHCALFIIHKAHSIHCSYRYLILYSLSMFVYSLLASFMLLLLSRSIFNGDVVDDDDDDYNNNNNDYALYVIYLHARVSTQERERGSERERDSHTCAFILEYHSHSMRDMYAKQLGI